jgi:hypothetical protein
LVDEPYPNAVKITVIHDQLNPHVPDLIPMACNLFIVCLSGGMLVHVYLPPATTQHRS